MPFCPHCGNEVEQLPGVAVAAEAVHVDLEIARIQAERDVAIARLQARADREALETAETIAETEAEAQVETAVAVAEVITAEDEAEPEPVVVDMPDEPAPEPEPEPDNTPPIVDVAQPKEKKSGGYWGAYK